MTPCGNTDVSNGNRRDPNWNFASNPSYAELDEMSIYVPTPESLVAETTNGDSSKTSCGNSDVSNSNRRDPNWNIIWIKQCMKLGKERNGGENMSLESIREAINTAMKIKCQPTCKMVKLRPTSTVELSDGPVTKLMSINLDGDDEAGEIIQALLNKSKEETTIVC
ncbi:hypothetical protein Patl1_19699 [Pistacia atlantica]|uniref:Uncharacterized protein n=1 Tax=Pistacia atlantica TaxID=434234 RepID=A0ACC1C3S7_9ROSI|nr:hypothetical protein Patl1_19699 [Pistacia atlantica]